MTLTVVLVVARREGSNMVERAKEGEGGQWEGRKKRKERRKKVSEKE